MAPSRFGRQSGNYRCRYSRKVRQLGLDHKLHSHVQWYRPQLEAIQRGRHNLGRSDVFELMIPVNEYLLKMCHKLKFSLTFSSVIGKHALFSSTGTVAGVQLQLFFLREPSRKGTSLNSSTAEYCNGTLLTSYEVSFKLPWLDQRTKPYNASLCVLLRRLSHWVQTFTPMFGLKS